VGVSTELKRCSFLWCG